jgi:hypothetical protein
MNPTDYKNLLQVVSNVVNYAYIVAPVITVAFIMLGGLRYIMAGGNKEKADKARATVTNAVIGLVVILVSFLIVDQVFRVMGANRDILNMAGIDFISK